MRKLKGFTLVEILIVIVIIGILIGALVPRMQGAQGRARDVARKNDLSQLQSAIVASQQDKGQWPALKSGAKSGLAVNDTAVSDLLQKAGLNSVPADPLTTTKVTGLGSTSISTGQYGYVVTKKNGTKDAGFVLMAKTENEGGSNWVYCDGNTTLSGGYIGNSTDIGKIQVCNRVSASTTQCVSNTGDCYYMKESQLRYILVY